MSKFKRVTSGLVGVAMAASMFTSMPFSAFAEDEAETNNQTYVYDDYEVSYQVTNSWGDTEVVSITLSNTGDSTIEDWMLYFDPNGEVQYTTDCQQLTTSDGISYFKNSGYNADVAPDSSVTFGYAVNDCEAVPESFTLCQKRGTKTDGYTVSLNVNQSWGDSFSGEIVIQNNTDTAIEAWELTIDTNFTITEITNSWAATVTELEPYSYLLKGTYTGTVAANSSVSLGFIGVKDGEPEISSYSLTEVQVDADYVTLLHCYEDWENLPDTDGDGLPDLYEQLIGTDAAVADTDQDQLPDGYEVKTLNTDGDLDFDNADPDPLNYQLNGYFAQKMGELQKAAQEYLENSYTSSENDDYYGRKDIWLAFTFLRCFNSDYNWNHSNWNNAAGTLSESEFNSFKNFLNSSYESVYKYFVNTTEINAGDLGEHIDLYHMCATLSAYSYNSFAKVLVDKEYIDNLCGWAGDFQTLMNSAYNKTYNTNQYTTIYDAFYNQMGRSDDYFSKDDLYADVASLGVNDIFLVSRNESLRDVFNSYFIYSSTSAYVKDIATVLSLSDMQTFTEKFTFSFFITKKIDQYDSSYNISDSDIQNGLSAFVAYLYDNYDCKIKQMPLEELNHMNKIEKRFKSFLASVCVFAFLCFGSTSVVALESSGSIKNIGWSISSDTLLLEDENGNWNAIFEGNICTVNGLILSASCVTFEELFSEENGDLFEWLSEHPIDTLSINVEVLDSIASEDHLIGNVDTLIIGKNVQSIRNDSFLDVKYLKNVYIYSSNIDLTNTGIGFSYEGELSDIVMYGYIGSTTETYANENGFTFIALDADPNTTTTTTDVIITTTDTTTVTTANSTETITETTTISNVESTVTTTETNFTTIGDMTTETVETTDSTSNTTTVANIVEVDETKALTDSSTTTELTSDIAKVDETAKAASTETSTNTTETTSTTTTTTDDTTLPQTGYSKWYHVVVILAACMTGTGAVMVIGSGALKRKQK